MFTKRKSVITATSCVTPIGKGTEATWNALLAQQNGITPITKFNAEQYHSSFAGEIKDSLNELLPMQGRSMMSYQNQLLLWSVIDAWNKSGLSQLKDQEFKKSIPIYLGSGCTNIDSNTLQSIIKLSRNSQQQIDINLFVNNIEKTPPLDIVKTMATSSNYFIAKTLETHGLGNPIFNGDASSLSALIMACKAIESGRNDVVIVASAENNLIAHYYYYVNELATIFKNNSDIQPEIASRPFDNDASGIIFSEGSGCIILESEEHAIKRNKQPLALMKGMSTNLYPSQNYTDLSKNHFEKNIYNTLKSSHLCSKDIDVILPFAPSYSKWDSEELQAIHAIFNEYNYSLVSAKGHFGFLGSCAGIVDTIIAQKIIENNECFKIKNFQMINRNIDEKITDHINKINNKNSINRCLINNAGLGGFYSSIILENGNIEYDI